MLIIINDYTFNYFIFTISNKDQDWFAKHGKQGKLNDSSRYIDKNYFLKK